MPDLYFAKVPFRNTYLRIRNRLPGKNSLTGFLNRFGINLLLDVGANKGQYGRHLIQSGYRGRIVSFEPLPSAREKLQLNRWSFRRWQVEPYALGCENGCATLNVAGDSQSSSLQPMLSSLVDAAPRAAYVNTCEVQVRRLDELFDRYYQPGDNCYLKLDVQGHEHAVIEGAAGCLDRIQVIQTELSMSPLYEGAQTWTQAIESLDRLGYQLMMLMPAFCNQNTGQMLQADGIFARREAVERIEQAARRACA